MVIEFTSYGYKENGIHHYYPEDYNQKNHVLGVYGDHKGYAISVIQLIDEPYKTIRIVVDEIYSTIMSFDRTLTDLKKLATKYQIRAVQVNEEYELEKIIYSRSEFYPFEINAKELKINTGLIEIAGLSNDGYLKIQSQSLIEEIKKFDPEIGSHRVFALMIGLREIDTAFNWMLLT